MRVPKGLNSKREHRQLGKLRFEKYTVRKRFWDIKIKSLGKINKRRQVEVRDSENGISDCGNSTIWKCKIKTAATTTTTTTSRQIVNGSSDIQFAEIRNNERPNIRDPIHRNSESS